MNKRDTPIGDLHKAELAKLRRKVAELEKMMLPNQTGVYLKALRWEDNPSWTNWNSLINACKKARGEK